MTASVTLTPEQSAIAEQAAKLLREISEKLSTPERRIVVSLSTGHTYEYGAPNNHRVIHKWRVNKEYESHYSRDHQTLDGALSLFETETPEHRTKIQLQQAKYEVKRLTKELRRVSR